MNQQSSDAAEPAVLSASSAKPKAPGFFGGALNLLSYTWPLILLCGFVWGVFSFLQAESQAVDKEIQLAYKTGHELVPEKFAKLDETTYQSDGLALRWKGVNSRIVHLRTETREHSSLFVESHMQTSWQVLAQTANGRWFLANYRVERGMDSDYKAAQRIYLSGIRPLSTNDIEYFLRSQPDDSKALQLYRKMFERDPAPMEIEA